MAATTPSSSSSASGVVPPEHRRPDGMGGGASRRPIGLWQNAMKRKDSFVQLFFMTGILFLSMRSLSQKYRIHDITRDNDELRSERDILTSRTAAIKEALLHEASIDPSGILSSHLRRLFGEN